MKMIIRVELWNAWLVGSSGKLELIKNVIWAKAGTQQVRLNLNSSYAIKFFDLWTT